MSLDSKRLGRAIVGAVGTAAALAYGAHAALNLPLGTLRDPGAGAYPLVVGTFLALVSVSIVVQTVVRRGESGTAGWPRGRPALRVLGLLAALVAFFLALPYLGFLLAGGAFATIVIRLLKPLSWFKIVPLAFGLSASMYLTFVYLLGLPMPAGILLI